MYLDRLLWLLSAFTVFIMEIRASSHWIVTESGLIKPKLDSPYEMARPYDLVGFLDQEKRWNDIFDLFNYFTKRQTVIDKLWDEVKEYSHFRKQVANDEDCVKAGNVNMIDWYAGLLEYGSKKINLLEFQLPTTYYGPKGDVPDCKRISSLTFSMFAFEHLESMMQRENLSANPELVLPELISSSMSIDQYGHWLTVMLRHNSSSWLHYNMASLYWRAIGNAPKAVECSRRALHYSPREYKDVALGSLGVVLHRCGKTNDAIIVLSAAVEHDPSNYVSHFYIANAYTVNGEFNTSLKFYDETLKLNPRMELAQTHKYGVLCYAKLNLKMTFIKQTLNNLRAELNSYYDKEEEWSKLQAEFLKTINSDEEYDDENIDKNNERMASITGLDIVELRFQVGNNSVIKYFLNSLPDLDDEKDHQGIGAVDTIYRLEHLVTDVNTKAKIPDSLKDKKDKKDKDSDSKEDFDKKEPTKPTAISGKEKPRENKNVTRTSSDKKQEQSPTPTEEELTEFETGITMYPSTMIINRNMEDFDIEEEWPSNQMCMETAPNFPENVEAIFPVFMPFENKGVRMKSLLTEKLGVPLSEEYELPWHPPTCPQDRIATAFTQKKSKPQISTEVVDTGYLRLKLLEYVSDGNVDAARHMQDAEIGQRIFVAMKKKLAPKWMVLTLSSLYWRVRNNNANALHCLLTAGRWVQLKYRDIVLTSLSSVYLEMGYFDEALTVAEEAFRLSLYEPTTNFLLAELNMLKKHQNTHMFHLKQVMRVEAGFLNGLARNLLNAWACILKQVTAIRERGSEDLGEGDICKHVQPLVDMLCEKEGENCQMSNIKCFNSQERADTSALVRLLQDESHMNVGSESKFFDGFIERTPDKEDTLAHHSNFDTMVKTIDNAIQGCGPRGCKNIKPEDLSLTEEDCSYQHIQLGYWLHVISFRQLVTDSNIELPSQITSMTPSNKEVPDCRLPSGPVQDFYMEKLSRVNTEGWGPVLSLMHQFSEMFDYFDYVTLGAKFAKYIDMHPKSWTGLVGAGWWCGASGRGECALRCLTAAHALAPQSHAHVALRALVALLHVQSKQQDAKEVAYLSFYESPKSKIEAFLVAVSHTYLAEYEQAMWMYRYTLAIDELFLPAKASLHATMCFMFYGEKKGNTKEQ